MAIHAEFEVNVDRRHPVNIVVMRVKLLLLDWRNPLPKRTYTRAHASARFWADYLDPLTITQALLLPPDTQHRRGEPRLLRTKSGKVEQRTPFRAGSWSMSSEHRVESPRLHIHLLWLLEQLEPHQTAIDEILANGVMADFFATRVGRHLPTVNSANCS